MTDKIQSLVYRPSNRAVTNLKDAIRALKSTANRNSNWPYAQNFQLHMESFQDKPEFRALNEEEQIDVEVWINMVLEWNISEGPWSEFVKPYIEDVESLIYKITVR